MMNTLLMLSRFANKTFALWVIIAGILGFVFPDVFKPIGSWIAILLGVMMFGMGLTLTTADFREIFRRPKSASSRSSSSCRWQPSRSARLLRCRRIWLSV